MYESLFNTQKIYYLPLNNRFKATKKNYFEKKL